MTSGPVKLVLIVLFLVCEILASTNLVPDPPKLRVVAAGLAFYAASLIF